MQSYEVPITDIYCEKNVMYLQVMHISVNSGPLKQVHYKGNIFILPHLNIKITNLSTLKGRLSSGWDGASAI